MDAAFFFGCATAWGTLGILTGDSDIAADFDTLFIFTKVLEELEELNSIYVAAPHRCLTLTG